MFKPKKKTIVIVLIIAILTIGFTTTAFAWSRLGTGHPKPDLDHVLWYRSSNAYEYRDSIENGINHWNGLTSILDITRTSVKADSRFDAYWGDYFPAGSTIIAQVQLYINSTELTYPWDTDWWWAKVKFNDDQYNYTQMTYFNRKGTACHEFGHFLGLAHSNNDTTSVMCQLGYGRAVESPSTDDVDGVNAINQ